MNSESCSYDVCNDEDALKRTISLLAHNSVSPPSDPLIETHVVQNENMPAPSVSINIQQPTPNFDHPETPQFEEEVSARVTRRPKRRSTSSRDSSNREKEQTL